MIREKEADREFRKKLQNPLNPVNSTETSPEMQEYLDDLNNNRLGQKAKKKELIEEEQRLKDKEKRQRMVCPKCHRGSLKRTPSGMYACGFCGLESNSPAFIIEEPK